jgi:hypothetical protein
VDAFDGMLKQMVHSLLDKRRDWTKPVWMHRYHQEWLLYRLFQPTFQYRSPLVTIPSLQVVFPHGLLGKVTIQTQVVVGGESGG